MNFGTENCPESSLCFALNYKPFYKAKTKLRMKKKYRRAVWISIMGLPLLIARGYDRIYAFIYGLNYKIKTKLRVYDYDPD